MRSVYAIKNSAWGIVYQICNIILGFIGRTIFIYVLGAEYLGISGLFTNILNLLSLSELGFATAVAYNLYKPIADDDKPKICAIMNFYKKVYRIVALTVLGLGITVIPFLKYIINESAFDIVFLQFIYVLFLIKTVTSYLFSYKFTLINADQSGYVLVNIDSIARIAITIGNAILLVLTHDYVCYLLFDILTALVINAIKAKTIAKRYPWLKSKEQLQLDEKKKIVQDVKNIFAGKVSTVIVSSTDNIIISIFINTLTVGIYDNYNMLINYVNGFIAQLTASTQASLGNVFASESKEYIVSCIKRMMFVIFLPLSICATCLFCALNPFIELWIGNEYVESQVFVFILIFNFFVLSIRAPLWQAVSVSGMFQKDKNIAIVGAVSNLFISLVLVKMIEMPGVILGTVLSQLIQMYLKARLLFREYLCFKPSIYYKLFIRYVLILLVQLVICYTMTHLLIRPNTLLEIIISCIISAIVCGCIILMFFGKSEEMVYTKQLATNILRKLRRVKDE